MILKRLYELAEREGLLHDSAFDDVSIACQINIGPEGEFLGVIDQRGSDRSALKEKRRKTQNCAGQGQIVVGSRLAGSVGTDPTHQVAARRWGHRRTQRALENNRSCCSRRGCRQ
jgi:hypothetical protein